MLILTLGEKWGDGAWKINGYTENGAIDAEIYINMQITVTVAE